MDAAIEAISDHGGAVLRTIAAEISGSFTAKVPPNPQHSSASGSSTRSTAAAAVRYTSQPAGVREQILRLRPPWVWTSRRHRYLGGVRKLPGADGVARLEGGVHGLADLGDHGIAGALVGAAGFITISPSGPFSQFTALPIQIFQWTALPQEEWRHLAAAASLALLILLLILNAGAVLLRNRYSRRMQ